MMFVLITKPDICRSCLQYPQKMSFQVKLKIVETIDSSSIQNKTKAIQNNIEVKALKIDE